MPGEEPPSDDPLARNPIRPGPVDPDEVMAETMLFFKAIREGKLPPLPSSPPFKQPSFWKQPFFWMDVLKVLFMLITASAVLIYVVRH